METDRDKSEKTFDETRAAPLEPKPKYQAPIVMPLGELIRGRGYCQGGPTANDGCGGGSQATGGTGCGGGNQATTGSCRGGRSNILS